MTRRWQTLTDDLRVARIAQCLATGDPADELAAVAAILLLGPVFYAGRLYDERTPLRPSRRRERRAAGEG